MLSAIKFDHNISLNTRKIGNKFPNGMLTPEAVTI